eukprot:UN34420
MKRFRGKKWRKQGATLHVAPIFETTRGYVESHEVTFDEGLTTIKDWLWFDEQPAINVLVRQNNEFILFKQTKYALEGESLAVVGGYIERGETSITTAKRELREELGLESKKWYDLGTYRTAVNRGAGYTTLFFADECTSTKLKIKSDDLEKQTVYRVTFDELIELLMKADFQEVKWTATVAMSLL